MNWILGLYSLYLSITSIKKLIKKPNDLTSYTILIIFVFNSFPVLLDILLGKPRYSLFPWYRYFDVASSSNEVSIVYSIYVLVVLFVLHINSLIKNRYSQEDMVVNKSRLFTGKLLIIIGILPVLFFILAGMFSSNPLRIFDYVSSSARGFNNVFMSLSTSLELLGIFTFTVWFFEKRRNKRSIIILFIYYFLIAWINGKRYIVVTEMLLFIYFFFNGSFQKIKKPKLSLKWIVLGLSILFFYFVYLINFKVIGELSLDFLYLTYRIDFGRDDVTKFVLYKEMIEKASILDYRGQTILSTLLFFIPRSFWPTKPYPHYRYLTAALFSTGVLDIPSGMTPSIFETSIANLGVIGGIFFTIIIIVALLRSSSKSKSISRKALYLMLLTALLTQSLDSIMIILLLLPISSITRRLKLGVVSNGTKKNIKK